MTTQELIAYLQATDFEIYETEDGSIFGGIDGMDMFDIDNGKIIFHCQSSKKHQRKSIDYFKSSKKEIHDFMKDFI